MWPFEISEAGFDRPDTHHVVEQTEQIKQSTGGISVGVMDGLRQIEIPR